VMASEGELVLIGANPAVLLLDGDRPTAFASLWLVEWSLYGSGHVLVVYRPAEVRILGENPGLGRWLTDTFVCHFGEAKRFGTPERVTAERTPVQVDLDLERGVTASAGDVLVEMTDVLDRRSFSEDGLVLGPATYDLRNVYVPCGAARLVVGGEQVPGRPGVTGEGEGVPWSSAFLAVAETWARWGN
jgi:hypothetical protein